MHLEEIIFVLQLEENIFVMQEEKVDGHSDDNRQKTNDRFEMFFYTYLKNFHHHPRLVAISQFLHTHVLSCFQVYAAGQGIVFAL